MYILCSLNEGIVSLKKNLEIEKSFKKRETVSSLGLFRIERGKWLIFRFFFVQLGL
jgi:hypothetical protein